MHHIVLVNPQIPQNTGTIARLCAATNSRLSLVGTLGFSLEDKYLKRAGLDYWEFVKWDYHPDIKEFLKKLLELESNKPFLLSSKATKNYTDVKYSQNQILVFGSETEGLSDEIKDQYPSNLLTIPMANKKIRSLNLANSVSIVLYEAIRQNH